MTTTLYNYIRSELIKKDLNEFVDDNGNLIFFEEEHQFLTKILSYDADVSSIMDKLFTGVSLDTREFDEHFKKGFVSRFLERRINRQTIEAFRLQLLSTFLTNKRYINVIYADLDKYIHQESANEQINSQKNQQKTDGEALTDNRQAFANLPQNNVQLDVNSTVMESASDNTISRNRQTNNQNSMTFADGETTMQNRSYQLDELLKLNGLEERIYNEFDRKCFMQIW